MICDRSRFYPWGAMAVLLSLSAGGVWGQSTPVPSRSPVLSPITREGCAYPQCPPLELERLRNLSKQPGCPGQFGQLRPGTVLQNQTYCQQGLTLPSLWWTQEQFAAQGQNYPEYTKLVQNWLTYLPQGNQPGRVDFVLELQRWSTMDYFKRYEFLTVFGGAAQRFGYNLRAFSFRGEFLGAYTCSNQRCTVDLEGGRESSSTPSPF